VGGAVGFGVLGPLAVTVGGRLVSLSGKRQRELLAVMLLRANHEVSVDLLADLMWRDQQPASAGRQVQNCVGRLRRTLTSGGVPAAMIETRPGGYLLRVADEVLARAGPLPHRDSGAARGRRQADRVPLRGGRGGG
jgi:DNA-binding SARP family transcriptional activator